MSSFDELKKQLGNKTNFKVLGKDKEGRLRAVIYVRYSSHNQNIESAEAQIRACEEYAEKHNMVILYIYQDLEVTGGSMEKRDEMKQLLNDSEKGLFDVVLAHKLDRVGRNLEEYLKNDAILEKNGVELIALDSPFGNDENGKFFKKLLMLINERFLKNLSHEITYKNKEYARKGYFLGGTAPFGYKVEKFYDDHNKERGRLVINPEEADIVRLIFNLYIKGKGTKSIVNELVSRGIKNSQGKPFYGNYIRRIINNDVYIGTYTHAKKSRNKNQESEPIIIEDNHDAIISKEIFEQAQNMKTKQTTFNRQRFTDGNEPIRKYKLTGLVKCADCGYSFTGSGGYKLYRYYKCSSCSLRDTNFCKNNKGINKEKFEDEILKLIQDKLFVDENIEYFTKSILTYVINNDENEKELARIKKEKEKRKKRFYRIEETYFDGKMSKERYDSLQSEFEKEQELFDKKIFELEISILPVNEALVRKYLNHIKNNIDSLSEEGQELLFKNVIEVIIADQDKIDVYFKIFSPYPTDDKGNNLNYILDKQTTALANIPLSKKGISIIRLKNGEKLTENIDPL